MSAQIQEGQLVEWGPDRRQGPVLRRHIASDGVAVCDVQSAGWHQTPAGYYQRDAEGAAAPCVLTIREADLSPVVEADVPGAIVQLASGEWGEFSVPVNNILGVLYRAEIVDTVAEVVPLLCRALSLLMAACSRMPMDDPRAGDLWIRRSLRLGAARSALQGLQQEQG